MAADNNFICYLFAKDLADVAEYEKIKHKS